MAAPDPLGDAVAYQLRLAQEASFAAFVLRVGDPDLRPGRYALLCALAVEPGATPSALSRACGRDKSTLTAALADLERRELVRRARIPGDARKTAIHLTAAGEAHLARLRVHADAHDRALDAIVGPDRDTLLALLRRITRRLSAPAACGSLAPNLPAPRLKEAPCTRPAPPFSTP